MTKPINEFHTFGCTRDHDHAIVAAGGETGWWDEKGHRGPWPVDFDAPAAGWTLGTGLRVEDIPPLEPGGAPF